MITPEKMRKLWIIGPKSVQKRVVEALYDLKAYHIRDHSKDPDFDIGSPLESAATLSEILVRIRSLISHLDVSGNEGREEKLTIHQIDSRSKKSADEVNTLVVEKRSVETKIGAQKGKLAKISQIKADIPLEAFFLLKSLKGYAGTLPSSEEEKARSRLGTDALFYSSFPSEKRTSAVIFVKKDKEAAIDALLSSHGFANLDMGDLKDLQGTPAQIAQTLSSEIAKGEKRLANLEKELSCHAKENRDFLLSSEKMLKVELLKAEAPLRFGNSRELFLASGWIPAARLEEAERTLSKAAQNKIHIQSADAAHEEDTPVKLNNPKPVDSFESLIRLFSWPKYGEIDPTALMAITLPLFFGMMLGDIGYGVITLFTFLFLKKKFPQGAPFFNVLIIGSLFTIFFGFLFGEVFGLEKIGGHHLWHVLSRAHDVQILMYITLAIGFIHVNLGYALGIYNEWKSHGFMTALTHKISWVLVEVALAFWFAAFTFFKESAASKAIAGVITVLALYLLYKGEGFIGIIEIPSLISHIVSYVRIMAVGLASVFLALLINQFVGMLFAKGMAWFIVLGIPLIIVGHGFNLALGILSPFLHSVRLHYVEFFTKFYRGGGKEFTPFGEQPKQQPI